MKPTSNIVRNAYNYEVKVANKQNPVIGARQLKKNSSSQTLFITSQRDITKTDTLKQEHSDPTGKQMYGHLQINEKNP